MRTYILLSMHTYVWSGYVYYVSTYVHLERFCFFCKVVYVALMSLLCLSNVILGFDVVCL